MIVLTVTDVPVALRGDLTKWLIEINTGVFIGKLSARVRDEVWERVVDHIKNGRATMVYSVANEQGLDFRVHNSTWEPIDFDGLKLMLKPSPARLKKLAPLRQGFSKAAQFNKQRRIQAFSGSTRKLSQPDGETYIVLDIETSGLKPKEHEITEIGAVRVINGGIAGSFQALVKVSRPLSQAITDLTGITDEMLSEHGEDLADVLRGFIQFAASDTVVCHNAEFDYGFLNEALKRSDLPAFRNRCVDTAALSRRLVRNAKNYKLATLLEHFELQPGEAHRSIGDCISTMRLYERLKDEGKSK
jgi:CRISPR-associated protein Cas2